MLNPIQAWRHFFRETIWQPDPQGRLAPWVFKTLQILILAFRDLIDKGALLRTSALGYASVLAIIPMLALLFAIFKGFGLQRLLAAHLLPQLAGGSQDFARQIISYVETTNVASLGVFGVIWLLVALMILMTNIEQAFNHIWKISRSRPWWRKLSDYLSIFLLFPILMAVAISMTSVLQSHPELLQSFKPFITDIFF
jgi:membrane protein